MSSQPKAGEQPVETDDPQDYDPSPYCQWCKAREPADCQCGEIVDNN